MPRPNNPIPQWMRNMFATVPGTRRLMRAGIYWIHEGVGFAMTQQPRLLKIGELLGKWNIRKSIKDPELRRKLTPPITGRVASESSTPTPTTAVSPTRRPR